MTARSPRDGGPKGRDRAARTRPARSFVSALAGAFLLGALGACKPIRPVDPGSPIGDEGSEADHGRLEAAAQEGALYDAGLAEARKALWDEGPGGPALADLPGRRAFLCAYGLDELPLCGSGVGSDLRLSVDAAAAQVRTVARGKLDKRAEGVRLKLDIARSQSPGTWKDDPQKVTEEDIALFGLWVEDGTQASWVLPSEILERDIYHFSESKKAKLGYRRKELETVLETRVSGFSLPSSPFAYTAIRTWAAVESSRADGNIPSAVPLYRTHALKYDEPDPDILLQRAVWAADHLISSVSEEGRIRYEYVVATDKDKKSYNILRHAGTTYSILQAYDRTKFEPYLKASEKAIEYYFSFCQWDDRMGPYGGGRSYWATSRDEGNYIKLGGVGLGLVMLSQYVESTGDRTRYVEQARGFGRYLASQLKEDGEFHYFSAVKPGDVVKDEYSAYYPGEAILGLVRLYQWDPDPKWLEIAERAAAWLIDVRDKGKDEKALENDHWLMIALSYLHETTGKDTYLEHSIKLARATESKNLKNEKKAEEYLDFHGSYYRPPRNTPAAVRGEGLTAVLDTCLKGKAECGFARDLLGRTVQHVLLSQYTPDLNWWPRNRAKAFGGISGGIADASIRNDYVQHAMSAILGLERHVRRERGETLPGGPAWTTAWKAGASFPGIAASHLTPLRAESLRHRGPTRWELGATAAPEGTPAPLGDEDGPDAEKPDDEGER